MHDLFDLSFDARDYITGVHSCKEQVINHLKPGDGSSFHKLRPEDYSSPANNKWAVGISERPSLFKPPKKAPHSIRGDEFELWAVSSVMI